MADIHEGGCVCGAARYRSAFDGGADDLAWPSEGPRLAEAVEELLKKPFSTEMGEHCQIGEPLSY